MESILLDVFEEHLNEAAFLWTQWEQALCSPDFNIEETTTIEARLCAHLDGLVIGEAPVAEALLKPSLESEDLSTLFAAAFALLAGAERTQLSGVLALLVSRPPEVHAPILRALQLNERDELAETLQPLLKESDPDRLTLALEALTFHDITSKDTPKDTSTKEMAVDMLLRHEEEKLLVAALRYLQPLPRHLVRGHLPRLLGDPRPAVRDAAMEAGLMAGVRAAWERCLDVAGQNAAPSRQQLLLLGLSGDSLGTDRLLSLLDVEDLRADVLWALGFSGQIAAAEACLKWLAHQEFAPLAGEAFSAITGLHLQGDHVREKQEEPSQEPLPLEEEDLDANLLPRPEDALPIPRPEAVGAWWHENRRNFTHGQRYLHGVPFTIEALLMELVQGPMRRRHAHALELALRSQGACRLHTRAFTQRQHTELAKLRNTALRLSVRPLPGILGDW
jgi:uncharacterized protein (TIGR02270 family)